MAVGVCLFLRLRRRAVAGGQRKPVVLGLAGGIGAGKSTVARILHDRGARVIDSDRLNHEQLADPEVIATLTDWYGAGICDRDGKVRPRALADLIFRDPRQRARVEALLHPRIERRRRELVEQYLGAPDTRLIVLDSPLLYEAGLDHLCDAVVFVDAPPEARRQRVTQERGWSDGELERREKSQKPLDTKRGKADYIIVNSSGLEDLCARVEKLLSDVLAQAPD